VLPVHSLYLPRRSLAASRIAKVALLVLAVSAGALPGKAFGQADVDFWKGTAERQATVDRFIYGQSPQAIPSSYDPVAEAEAILRQHQASLPASNPGAPSLWQQIRTTTVKTGLSRAPRVLGTIGLAVDTAVVAWKIGSGINAKIFRFGVPDMSNAGPANYNWDKIVWTQALKRTWAGAQWPAEDGWVLWARQTCCNYSPRDWWYTPDCVASPYGFMPPAPFATQGPLWSGSTCYNPAPPGYTDAFVYYAWAPENALPAAGPIEPYTNQPYRYSSSALAPPPQTTVEQSIETELEKPENSLLRQWLNYELGSPGETDPVGDGVNVPAPSAAPGELASPFAEELEDIGLTNVKFRILSDPDFDPAFDEGAVVRVSPPPGTSVEPEQEIVVTDGARR
jgi:hypothetical protein